MCRLEGTPAILNHSVDITDSPCISKHPVQHPPDLIVFVQQVDLLGQDVIFGLALIVLAWTDASLHSTVTETLAFS